MGVTRYLVLVFSMLPLGCTDTSIGGGGGDLSHPMGDLATGARDLARQPDLATQPPPDLSTQPPADLATPPDLAKAPPPDLAMTSDGGPPQGGNSDVLCGPNSICKAPASVCCSGNHGFSGNCVAPGNPCANGTIAYYCDDNADCPVQGQVCCLTATIAQCTTSADCANAMGTRMCSGKNDCAVNENCCGFSPQGGGYGKCGTGPCPICGNRWSQYHAIRVKKAREAMRKKQLAH